jgi:arsenate reductase
MFETKLSMAKLIILHNPKCSKSRQALAQLETDSHPIQIIEYLKEQLAPDLIDIIINSLKHDLPSLIRTKEEEYKSNLIDLNDKSAVKNLIIKMPKLLQRPIVIKGKKAIIARDLDELDHFI